MMGIMPPHIYERGPVGIVSRSGTLGYEAASQLKAVGIGVSTSVGIGGDPINGSSFLDHLKRFENDNETEAVVMIRRDRRAAGGAGRGLRPCAHAQAGGGLHCRSHRAQGAHHGPCGCDCFHRWGIRR